MVGKEEREVKKSEKFFDPIVLTLTMPEVSKILERIKELEEAKDCGSPEHIAQLRTDLTRDNIKLEDKIEELEKTVEILKKSALKEKIKLDKLNDIVIELLAPHEMYPKLKRRQRKAYFRGVAQILFRNSVDMYDKLW